MNAHDRAWMCPLLVVTIVTVVVVVVVATAAASTAALVDCRNVVFPWLSDVTTVTSTGKVISGIVDGMFTLTVTTNDTVCFVASPLSVPAEFVWPVAVVFGPSGAQLSIDYGMSNATHVCGQMPPLEVLCNFSAACMDGGTIARSRSAHATILVID